MAKKALDQLGRRERQIMEIIYRLGKASGPQVLAELPDPPSYTAVRGMLRILEDKGYLRHEQDGPRYIYSPTVDARGVSRSAIKHLVSTFFDGSASSAVAAMVGVFERDLNEEDFDALQRMIDRARANRGVS